MVYLLCTVCIVADSLNSFFFGPQQAGFTANYTHSLDEQSIHLAYILKSMREKNMSLVEASKEGEEKLGKNYHR